VAAKYFEHTLANLNTGLVAMTTTGARIISTALFDVVVDDDRKSTDWTAAGPTQDDDCGVFSSPAHGRPRFDYER